MSIDEFHYVAVGWALLLVFLTLFWFLTLRRLSVVLKERITSTRSHQTAPEGILGLCRYLVRGDFRQAGDERLTAVCKRLRHLLYGYFGVVIGYFVFLVLMRSHY